MAARQRYEEAEAALADLLLRLQATTLASDLTVPEGLPAADAKSPGSSAVRSGSSEVQLQLPADELTKANISAGELAAELDLLIASLDSRRAQLQTTIDSAAAKADLLRLQEQLEREQGRERQLKTARDLASETYVTLSRKGAEGEVATQVRGQVVRLDMPATPPPRPFWPNKRLSLSLAAVLGAILGIAVALTFELMDCSRLPRPTATRVGLGSSPVPSLGPRSS